MVKVVVGLVVEQCVSMFHIYTRNTTASAPIGCGSLHHPGGSGGPPGALWSLCGSFWKVQAALPEGDEGWGHGQWHSGKSQLQVLYAGLQMHLTWCRVHGVDRVH